jgi:hypothetical protein
MVVHLTSPDDRYDMTYLRNYAVLNVKDRLARIQGVGEVQLFGSGDYAMRVWLDPEGGRARPHRQRRGQGHPRAERAGGRRRDRRAAQRRARPAAQRQRPGPPADEAEFGDIIVKTAPTAASPAWRHRPHRAGRAEYALRSLLDNKPPWPCRSSRRRAPTPSRSRRGARDDGRAEGHARRRGLQHRLRPDAVRAPSIEAVVTRCSRPSRWWCWW